MADEISTARNKQLLMGSGDSELNLENVRKRSVEVLQQLAQLQARFAANPAAIGFEALLAEFAILSKQFTQLQADVRPATQYYVAHPMELTEANRDLVPEQLASLALPEMAAAEAELLDDFPIKPQDDLEAAAACAAIQDIPHLHNQQIGALFQEAAQGRPAGVLHARADTRRDVARAFAKLQSDMIQLQRKKQAAASAEATGKAAQPSSQNPSVAAVVRAFQQGRF